MSDNASGLSFVWKIENFSMLPHQERECLESPKFVVDGCDKDVFFLEFYPRSATKGKLAVYLFNKPRDKNYNFTIIAESTESSAGNLKADKTLYSKFRRILTISDIYDKSKCYLPQDTLTLRCDISTAEKTSEELNAKHSNSAFVFPRKRFVLRTCFQVQRRSILWSIRNIKKSIQQSENVSILTNALINYPSLKLTLNFNKIKSGDDIPISIFQTCLSSQEKRLYVKCKITVMSIHEEFQTSSTSSHLFELSTSDVWSFPSFLTTGMLSDKKYLKVDNTLFLRCEFAFSYKDSEVHHFENNYFPCTFQTRQESSELSTCFEDLYGSCKFCDVELKAGGRTFPYYKTVLCARSPVFTAMFKDNMKEKNSNVVEIEDVDPNTLQRMLTYMHSDILQKDLLPEDVCKLYVVADKYDLASLKNKCSVLLATTVSVLNVCDLLVFADAHLDNFLMTAVNDFICSHTTEVLHSVQWETFMEDNPKLACLVMHKMMTGKCQI